MECRACDAYEKAVMERASGDPDPPQPCDHYEMSPAFRDWLVDRMRGEVLDQTRAQGLDRLGIVKGRAP